MKRILGYMALLLLASGCAEEAPTFSILPASDQFYQNASTVNNKLDILWVVDNSGSMQEEQDNLVANFNSFIRDFSSKGFDYHIGVTVTDAYKVNFGAAASVARLKDGTNTWGHTGVFVINPATPNLFNTFTTNARQGTSGSGDERAFSSFKSALSSNLNTDFRRPDGYLAIIIVSDEDDFSWDGSAYINRDYNYPGLHTVQSYVTYLDQLTQSTGSLRRYSVSAITIKDQACLAANQATSGIMGQRYIQLAGLTNGVVGDICSPNFSTELDAIQSRIAELSTQFFLSRQPIPSTIVVHVNGALVYESATNGWTYNSDTNSIVFHGAAIPPQGAGISVDFDPLSVL